MRVALDTNVLVSAMGWSGPEEELVRRGIRGEVELVLSLAVVAELVEVLARPAFQHIARGDLAAFLQVLLEASTLVAPEPFLHVVHADPADDRVLEGALAGGSDLIVSGDRHLLELGTFQGIPVLRAPAALVRLADETATPSS